MHHQCGEILGKLDIWMGILDERARNNLLLCAKTSAKGMEYSRALSKPRAGKNILCTNSNLVGVIGSPPESDWQWISLIHCQHDADDMTPGQTSQQHSASLHGPARLTLCRAALLLIVTSYLALPSLSVHQL